MKKGWEIKKLGDLAKTSSGGTPLKSKTQYYEGGNIPWLRSGEVAQSEIYSSVKYITEAGLQNSSAKLIHPESVLVAMYGATAGQVGILKFEASTNQAVCAIFPQQNLLSKYTYFFFLHHKAELLKEAVGNAQPNISQAKIKNTLIPVPPLAEQEAIVEVLDKAFAAIDQAKANIEQNIANAKELFQSKLNQIFSQKGDGWVDDAIENLCVSVIDCINKTAPKVDYETDYKMIRTTNVRHGKVALENVKYVTKETYEKWIRRQTPEIGDVLFTREAPLGEAGILKDEAKVFLGQRIVSYRVDARVLDNHFLLYSFQSPPMQKQIEGLGSGATVQHMRVPDTKKLLVNHPILKVQKRIVGELTKIDDDCEQIIKVYQTKLDALDELKKSILKKAFKGELTN